MSKRHRYTKLSLHASKSQRLLQGEGVCAEQVIIDAYDCTEAPCFNLGVYQR